MNKPQFFLTEMTDHISEEEEEAQDLLSTHRSKII